MPLNWENTDQFGNLKVAHSSASSLEELLADVAELAEVLAESHEGPLELSFDGTTGEVLGPSVDHVTHILQVPELGERVEEFVDPIGAALAEQYGDRIICLGAWP